LHSRLAVEEPLPVPATDVPTSSTSSPPAPLPSNKEAHILLLSTIAHTKLVFGDEEGAKTDMDSAFKVLDELEGVESSVRAAYYGVAADYYKVSLLKLSTLLSLTPSRQRHITHLIIATPSCTWHALTQKRTCRQRKGWLVPMIWVLQLSWQTAYTISASWQVSCFE
jgi:hypothetical protein